MRRAILRGRHLHTLSRSIIMSAPQVETSTGRDENGRFTLGNPGGPGNTGARRVAQLRRLRPSKISDEDAGAIMDKLIEMAKEGTLSAIKLVLDYTVGKPGPVHLLSDPYEAPPTPRPQQQGANAARSP